MKKVILATFLFLYFLSSYAQVSISTTNSSPDASAMLDIKSSTKGLLIPRMDSSSVVNITSPAKGLMVFDSSRNSFYYYNGTSWLALASMVSAADSIWAINPNGTGIQSLLYDSRDRSGRRSFGRLQLRYRFRKYCQW